MPIKVPNNLPAVETLTKENVFVMTDSRAMTQDIRPLQILILNLMPTKVDTETQLTRLLGNTPLQVELELLQISNHKTKNTSEEHMIAFYKTFDQIRGNYYDGMIITGAPVETLPFEEVDYWDELCEIMEWTKSHVHSIFYLCWGAQAGLYYHYGINKYPLPKKLSGVYEHHLEYKTGMLFRGFDDSFYVPHSRNTYVKREDVEACEDLRIVASSDEAGIFAVKSVNDREIFIMGHSEYDADTLLKEYIRDKEAGINPEVPEHYFPNDDDTKEPIVRWRSCANLLYSNWLNYFVYQSTPYDISRISEEDFVPVEEEKVDVKAAKFGGTCLADAKAIKETCKVIKNDDAIRYVVVSAPGKRRPGDKKITDLLVQAAGDEKSRDRLIAAVENRFREIEKELKVDIGLREEIREIRKKVGKKKDEAYVISRGEYLLAKLVSEYLGYEFMDARDLIVFDKKGAYMPEATKDKMQKILKGKKNVVIPGFYGAGPGLRIFTFPRGGSDITGAIVSEVMNVDLYENWTDVSGMLMADPDVVKDPLTVPIITYKELRELSVMGAEVLHEDAVFPVRKVGIPINIRNIKRPKDPGTMIVNSADYYRTPIDISGISGKTGYTSIKVEKDKLIERPGDRNKIMRVLADLDIKVANVLTATDELNIIVNEKDVKGRVRALTQMIKEATDPSRVSITSGLAMVAVVGREMASSPSVAVKVLSALAGKKINVKLLDHGMEGISMLVGVDEKDYQAAVRAIYSEFIKK